MTREELILAHLPRVRQIAKMVLRQHHGCGFSFEEYESAGTQGMIQALDRYDPGRSVSISTFISIRAEGEMLDMLRRRFGRACQPSAAAKRTEQRDDLFFETLVSPYRSPEELCAAGGQARRLSHAIDSLPVRQRLLVRGIFYEEMMLSEMAERLGVHYTRISQLKKDALRRLRVLLTLRPHEGIRPQEEIGDDEQTETGKIEETASAKVLREIENKRQALLARGHSGRQRLPFSRRRCAAGQAQGRRAA